MNRHPFCTHNLEPCAVCHAAWMAAAPARRRQRERKQQMDEQIKADITAILGKLIAEKAIDQARAAAQ